MPHCKFPFSHSQEGGARPNDGGGDDYSGQQEAKQSSGQPGQQAQVPHPPLYSPPLYRWPTETTSAGTLVQYLTLHSIRYRCKGGQQRQQATSSLVTATAVQKAKRCLALLSFPLHRCTGGPLPKITGIFSSLKGEEPRYPGLAKILNSRYSIHRCTGGQACIRAFFFFRILNNLSTAVQEAECGRGGGCFSAAQT